MFLLQPNIFLWHKNIGPVEQFLHTLRILEVLVGWIGPLDLHSDLDHPWPKGYPQLNPLYSSTILSTPQRVSRKLSSWQTEQRLKLCLSKNQGGVSEASKNQQSALSSDQKSAVSSSDKQSGSVFWISNQWRNWKQMNLHQSSADYPECATKSSTLCLQ